MHYPGIGVVGGDEDAAAGADAELGAVAGGSQASSATPTRTDVSDDDSDDADDDAARVPAVMAARMSMDTGTLAALQAGHHHEPADSALVMAR